MPPLGRGGVDEVDGEVRYVGEGSHARPPWLPYIGELAAQLTERWNAFDIKPFLIYNTSVKK